MPGKAKFWEPAIYVTEAQAHGMPREEFVAETLCRKYKFFYHWIEVPLLLIKDNKDFPRRVPWYDEPPTKRPGHSEQTNY